MAPDPSAFVCAVAEVDLVLAGRCAAQGEVAGRIERAVVDDLRRRLADRTRLPEADLRARIAAGLTLGWLGGPCYEEGGGAAGRYLVPPMAPVAGGTYVIGSSEAYSWAGARHREELPAAPVVLGPFALARFAVTNAEWATFMAGGGYEDEAHWEGDAAQAWLRGEGTMVNVRSMARWWRRRFLEEPGLVERELERDHMDESMYELWHRRLAMDDERFERHLLDDYPAGPLREPRYWRDPRYNNPMQPVIGISCFEARAYTAWLASQSGRPFRLPTEAEWEAAARGAGRRVYAYGDEFDPLRGNTVETHVRAPTPVGVFPEGDTPEGIADLTGNTYDLTSSLWGDDPLRTSWPYPYRADDGREAVDVPVTVSRVGRGGAWYLGEVHARAAYRGRDRYDLRPDEWLNFRGCRVAMDLER
jgi:formylglycine-generating enzyme required for sulfatase activity